MQFCKIIPFANIPYGNNQVFSYKTEGFVPLPGMCLEIPFAGRKIPGVIVSVMDDPDDGVDPKRIKTALRALYPTPIATETQITLFCSMSDYYLVPLTKIAKTALPKIPKKPKIKPFLQAKNTGATTPNKKPELLICSKAERIEAYKLKAKAIIRQGGQIAIIVPEIFGLLQFSDIFKNEVPDAKISLFSSLSSPGEYFSNWIDTLCGETDIILGTRQAVFAPFGRLETIVIEDEQNTAHKQWEMNPRYDARTVAGMLSTVSGSEVIYGSSLPSVKTYHLLFPDSLKSQMIKTEEPRTDLATVEKNRIGKIENISIIDMRLELRAGNRSIFSHPLSEKLDYLLDKKIQSLLIVNQRAFFSTILCRDCGLALKCTYCGASVSQRAGGGLECLRCGKRNDSPSSCPACGSHLLKGFGIGAEKVLQETAKIFPDAKIALLTKDTPKNKSGLRKLYQDFDTSALDIVVGTGAALNLSSRRLGLIAFLNADSGIQSSGWNEAERTLSRIAEASGSCEVLIQSYNPEHPFFAYLGSDLDEYLENEMETRKAFFYPPFSQIIKLEVKDALERNALEKARSLENRLRLDMRIELETGSARIIPANASGTAKTSGKFSSKLIIFLSAGYKSTPVYEKIKLVAKQLPAEWTIDVDPEFI